MESSRLKEAAEAIAKIIPLKLVLPLFFAGHPIKPTATAVRPAANQVDKGMGSWEKPSKTRKKATKMD